MTQDELQIARNIRRTMDKYPLDTNLCAVTITKNRLYLGGQIKLSRSARNADIKDEVEMMKHAIMRGNPSLREIVMECRIIKPEAVAKPEHAAPGAEVKEEANFGPPKEEQGNTHHIPGRHF